MNYNELELLIDNELLKDENYIIDSNKLLNIYEEYLKLNLSVEDRKIINEYISLKNRVFDHTLKACCKAQKGALQSR